MSGSPMRRTQVDNRLTVNYPDQPAPTTPINPATGQPRVVGSPPSSLPVGWMTTCPTCSKYRFATRNGAERAGVAYGAKVFVEQCPDGGYHLTGEPSQASMGGVFNVR